MSSSAMKYRMAGFLAIASMLGFLAMFAFIATSKIPVENRDFFNMALIALIGFLSTAFGYYLGSSQGSARKTELQGPTVPPADGQSGKGNTMAIMAVFLVFVLFACATTLPSKYDTYEGCLICDIAKERGVRIEDVGNLIRVAGAVARAEDLYTTEQAIEALTRVRRALSFPLTGVALVGELEIIADEYAEVIEIAMSYTTGLAVPQLLDDQSVRIMLDFVDGRIAYLQQRQAGG